MKLRTNNRLGKACSFFSRYSFLVFLLLLLGPFVHGAGKPNVLFIAVDDMNDWTTLFDEKNPIQTPNLQRL